MHSIPQWKAGEWSDVAQTHIKDGAEAKHSMLYFHFNFNPYLSCSSSDQIRPLLPSPKCQNAISSHGQDQTLQENARNFFWENLHFKTNSKHIIPNCNFFICYFTYMFKDSYLIRRMISLQFYSYYILFPLCHSKVKVEFPAFTYTPLSFVFNFLNLIFI